MTMVYRKYTFVCVYMYMQYACEKTACMSTVQEGFQSVVGLAYNLTTKREAYASLNPAFQIPKAQHSPTTLHNMDFGPKSLKKYESLEP